MSQKRWGEEGGRQRRRSRRQPRTMAAVIADDQRDVWAPLQLIARSARRRRRGSLPAEQPRRWRARSHGGWSRVGCSGRVQGIRARLCVHQCQLPLSQAPS